MSTQQHESPAVPDLITYQIRIRQTGRYMNVDFLEKARFDATPETVAEFTDQDTAFRVLSAIQREIDAMPMSMRFPSPCALEIVKREYIPTVDTNDGFRVWAAELRARDCHETARRVLAEKRPTYFTRPRLMPDLGAAFIGLVERVVGAR